MHITVHLGLLVLGIAFAFFAGILYRLVQVRILRSQVQELEKEKMMDHAEILLLQKKMSEQKASKSISPAASTPVVLFKDKESGQPDNGKNKKAQ